MIRTELEEFIQREGLNLSRLGKLAGLNAGTVSAILKGNRVMAVDQLDRMTSVLALPQGYFYKQYIQECMVEAVPNWRRIRPFLYRCAELDKLECIEQIVTILMDNLNYSPLLFEVAEDFFRDGKYKAAELLYESVATSERRQHSERLAFCHYRLFTIRLGDDQEQNLQAALQFEPFVDRLDIIDQLDALRELASTYRSLHKWDKVERLACEMGGKADILLFSPYQPSRRREGSQKKPKRPLFTYKALSSLHRGGVCKARGDYEQAFQYDSAYEDLSWVKEEDEETQHWVNTFKGWAQANMRVSRLDSGDSSVLPDYISYIQQNPDEVLTGLLNIMRAANRLELQVDDILQSFKSEISYFVQQKQLPSDGMYSQHIISERRARLLFEIAHYYLRKGKHPDGFEYLLIALDRSAIVNSESFILKCVRLFESCREFASHETQTEYKKLIMKEEDVNEKESSSTIDGV